MVIRISEGPTAADRHEARVPHLREDQGWHSYHLHPAPTPQGAHARPGTPQSKATNPSGRSPIDTSDAGEAFLVQHVLYSAGEQAELITLGVGEDDPADVGSLADIHSPSTEITQPL